MGKKKQQPREKKLEVRKETIRALEDKELETVQGGLKPSHQCRTMGTASI